MKCMENEEKHMLIIKAIEDGVKETNMIPLLTTPCSQLANYQDVNLQVCSSH